MSGRKLRVLKERLRSGRWLVKAEQPNGQWRSLDTYDTEEEAEAMRAAAAKRVNQRSRRRVKTLADYAKERLADREGRGLASVRSDRSRWRTHLAGESFVQLPPSRVTRRDVRRFRERLVKRDISAKTAREVMLFVSGLFDDLVEDQVIASSPMAGLRTPSPAGRKATGYLYPAEDAALMACEDIPLCYRVLYGFLAREGMRKSEALALTWDDVDLERGVVRLDENKSKDPRAWALGLDVVTVLTWWKEQAASPAVFSGARTSDLRTLRATMFRRHLRDAGVERPELFEDGPSRVAIRVHDLRATFVTLALAGGRTETWVTDRTGHKSHAMVNRYRRAARMATELGLGWLEPFDHVLPEAPKMIGVLIGGAPEAASVGGGEMVDLMSGSEAVAPPRLELGCSKEPWVLSPLRLTDSATGPWTEMMARRVGVGSMGSEGWSKIVV